MTAAKLGKSVGVDGLPNEVFKNKASLELLCAVFNKCFTTGLIPTEWAKSVITPIPKWVNIDRHVPMNYRGSLLCTHTNSTQRSSTTDWSGTWKEMRLSLMSRMVLGGWDLVLIICFWWHQLLGTGRIQACQHSDVSLIWKKPSTPSTTHAYFTNLPTKEYRVECTML